MDLSSRTSDESLDESFLPESSQLKERLLSQSSHLNQFANCCSCEKQRRFYAHRLVPLFVAIAFFISLLIFGLKLSAKSECYSFWLKTDFIAAKKELPKRLKEVRFTAGLRYNEHKQLYRPIYPDQPQFVGPPSQEIDDAWEDLIGAVNIFVTSKEEITLPGDLYFQPESRLYMGQPTVFHDLHCLNMLRQNLHQYYDYYTHNDNSILLPHIEHCLDGLRQSLMCAGDMTVAPTLWSEEKGRILPDFEVDHTCRDYETLKDWSRARDSADPHRYPQNAERLHAEGN